MVEDAGRCVYGILVDVPANKVRALYDRDWVRHYNGESVMAVQGNGERVPALCYISSPDTHSPASAEYVERIAGPAQAYGFPEDYVDRIRRFSRDSS